MRETRPPEEWRREPIPGAHMVRCPAAPVGAAPRKLSASAPRLCTARTQGTSGSRPSATVLCVCVFVCLCVRQGAAFSPASPRLVFPSCVPRNPPRLASSFLAFVFPSRSHGHGHSARRALHVSPAMPRYWQHGRMQLGPFSNCPPRVRWLWSRMALLVSDCSSCHAVGAIARALIRTAPTARCLG